MSYLYIPLFLIVLLSGIIAVSGAIVFLRGMGKHRIGLSLGGIFLFVTGLFVGFSGFYLGVSNFTSHISSGESEQLPRESPMFITPEISEDIIFTATDSLFSRSFRDEIKIKEKNHPVTLHFRELIKKKGVNPKKLQKDDIPFNQNKIISVYTYFSKPFAGVMQLTAYSTDSNQLERSVLEIRQTRAGEGYYIDFLFDSVKGTAIDHLKLATDSL